jgi:uncharacterized protein YdhG (YjbR/CyaY superfamily)
MTPAKPPLPASIDDYIAGFAPEVQAVLQQVRATITQAAPRASETISYRMPAFFQDGALVYFAAFKKHIGLYPPVRGDAALMARLAPHAGPKGNLQLPLNQPMPLDLITQVVQARLQANQARAAARARKPQRAK